MQITTIICGVLLILIGIVGYIHGMMTEHASATALIPAAFGAVLAVLGYFAAAKEALRKHLMHVAVIVALLGFIATASRLVQKFDGFTLTAAVVSQIAMAAICLIYVLLAIRSFANARRSR